MTTVVKRLPVDPLYIWVGLDQSKQRTHTYSRQRVYWPTPSINGYQMLPHRSSALRILALAICVGAGIVFVSQFPTISTDRMTVQTSFLVPLIAGLLLTPTIISSYRSNNQRGALQYALIAIGLPIALLQYPAISWIGVLAIWVSVGVGWELDRKVSSAAF